MWSIILGIISKLVGYFFGTDERDKAEQTGEKVGHGDDAAKSLDAAQQAQEARNRVDIAVGTKPDSLRQSDGFQRPD